MTAADWCSAVHRSRRVAVAEVEPELGVVLSGGDVVVGVGVHARRDPQQDVRPGSALPVEELEPVELVEAVDHDVAHAAGDRRAELVETLVVAVERARRRGHAGGEDDMELTAAGDIEEQPLVVGQARHRPAEERLGRVDHAARAERVDRVAAAGAHVGLVVDEQRRAELLGQGDDRATADLERSVRADGRGVGQQLERQRAHDRATITPARAPPSGRESCHHAFWAGSVPDVAKNPAQIAKLRWYLRRPSAIMSSTRPDEPRRRCPDAR